jgi:hypothetical protein
VKRTCWLAIVLCVACTKSQTALHPVDAAGSAQTASAETRALVQASDFSLFEGGPDASATPLVATDEGKPFFEDYPARVAASPTSPTPVLRTVGVSVRQGRVTSSGMPPEIVQRIARHSWGRFRLCYDIERKLAPKSSGELQVLFRIGKDGSVASSKTKLISGTLSEALRDCVANTFLGASFPQPDPAFVDVTYSLFFSYEDP